MISQLVDVFRTVVDAFLLVQQHQLLPVGGVIRLINVAVQHANHYLVGRTRLVPDFESVHRVGIKHVLDEPVLRIVPQILFQDQQSRVKAFHGTFLLK